MKKILWLSITINVICLPLAGIYVVRKIQFYDGLAPVPNSVSSENIFWKIRNSEFKALDIDSNAIVFLGDSQTQNFELSEAFNNLNVRNRGIALDGSASILSRINYLIDKHPKKIFIQIGINDLLSGVQPHIVAKDVNSMILQIKSISPKTAIFIQSVFPTNWNRYKDHKPVFNDIVELNKHLQALSLKYDCTYVDLFSLLIKGTGLNRQYDCGDSLHLNGQGYLLWTETIKRFVEL